jgi:hypothetical protein
MNAAPTDPGTSASGKEEPRRTTKKNRKGHKVEHWQANHYIRINMLSDIFFLFKSS